MLLTLDTVESSVILPILSIVIRMIVVSTSGHVLSTASFHYIDSVGHEPRTPGSNVELNHSLDGSNDYKSQYSGNWTQQSALHVLRSELGRLGYAAIVREQNTKSKLLVLLTLANQCRALIIYYSGKEKELIMLPSENFLLPISKHLYGK